MPSRLFRCLCWLYGSLFIAAKKMTIKIEFWLKKSDTDKGSLEHITIGAPKIDTTVKPNWGNCYICEVYLSSSKAKNYPIYGINLIDTLCLASEFTKNHLQVLIKRGYIVSEVESKEPWKLEKLSDNFLQGKINELKNNPTIPQESKNEVLKIIKDSFSKTVIKDQLNKAIDEN